MGVLGGFAFAAQLVNFSIPGTGSSGHLGGGLLLAVLLGPTAAFLVMASVPGVQALSFADGGLLALGCNVFNIFVPACFLAYPLLFRPLAGARPGRARRMAAALVASAELHSLLEVARRLPHATIALLSALQVHGLTTEAPHAVWILIDRHARAPKVTYPKLEVVYASGAALAHGVETRTIEGVPVRLTTPAKTVADCFRYRRHVGPEAALAALRGYLRRPVARGGAKRVGSPIDDLVAAARADRVSAVLRPYLEALA